MTFPHSDCRCVNAFMSALSQAKNKTEEGLRFTGYGLWRPRIVPCIVWWRPWWRATESQQHTTL